MKNFVKRSIKKSAKTLSTAAGLNAPINVGKTLLSLISNFFGAASQVYPKETFEEVIARLDYTEQQIQALQSAYLNQALCFFCCALAVFAYALYRLANMEFSSALVASLGALMLFSYAFRAHFNFFQIKNRKLGCTFKEWFNGQVGGRQ